MHQIKLHPASNEITIAKGGRGVSATTAVGSRTVDVDFEKNTAIQKNSKEDSGNVSADGKLPYQWEEPLKGTDAIAKPTLRSAVVRGNSLALPSGKSAFHFLPPVEGIPGDPVTAQSAARAGLQVWIVEDKRIVTYPYRYNPLLNSALTPEMVLMKKVPPPRPGVSIKLCPRLFSTDRRKDLS